MCSFDPIGRSRFSFLKGQPTLQQYRLLLSFYGAMPHAGQSCDTANLRERIQGVQAFVDAQVVLYENVISPTELTSTNFAEVSELWHQTCPKWEFALRAKAAAWLFDLLIGHDECPYQAREECSK